VDETMSTVALAVSPADLDVEQGSESDLDTANRIFAAEFAQALPRKLPRLLIVHTVHPMFLDGLVDYLVTAERGGQSSLLLGFVAMPFTTESTDTIRQSLARLSHVALRILLVGETEAAADQLRGIAPPSLSVTSSPFVGVYLTQPRRNVRSDEAVTAGFVGQMRKERGANLIPEIAALTTTANPGRLKWRVQFDRGQAGERFDDQAASQLDALSGAGKLNIIEGGLTTRDYQALLGSIDIMVMPYSQSYSVSPSGVAVESLMSGCVLVAPAESTMAAMAERFDAGIVTFRHQTAATISDAVNEAVDRFDNLAAKASTAAARMADAKTSAPILRFIASA
jgi:glycosyltransferase involved in cell wall biosynthesis